MHKFFTFDKPKGYVPSTLSTLKDAVRETEDLLGEMTFTRKQQDRYMTSEEKTQLAELFQDLETAMETAKTAILALDAKAVKFCEMQAAVENRKAEADAWEL